jgi:hypothetical protein
LARAAAYWIGKFNQVETDCLCANERWDDVIGDQALILRVYEKLLSDEGPFTSPRNSNDGVATRDSSGINSCL